MKRLFVLLAALAATSAILAGSAFAGGNGTTIAKCDSTTGYFLDGSTVPGNLDIPAGTFCLLTGEFKGVVNVEGYAAPWGATFDKPVNVDGGWLIAQSGTTEFKSNLNITGSNYGMEGVNGLFADSPITIDGNLNYTGNSIPLMVRGPQTVTVKGTFNYSGNTVPWGGSSALHFGNSSIS
jgi:hypothetical protein